MFKVHTKRDNNIIADLLSTITLLFLATVICLFIHNEDSSGSSAAIMIFILTVLAIARITDGYFYGILSSVIGVVVVNFIFTYPFMKLNFTLTGYPLTFFTMLAVSIITSTTATQIKKSAELRLEKEREQVRSNLLRAVSHDLRTPLTSIIGASDVLLDDSYSISEEHRRQLLEDIHDDGQWLINVTENILSITRIGGNNEIIKTYEIGDELIELAVRKFNKRHPDAPQININLPDTTEFIPMDLMLVEQVLLNLMENAMIHGRTTTLISIELSYANGDAIFRVTNNGIPIPDSMLPTLFSGSMNSDVDVVVNNKRCAGIGLSVCKTIINAHHGTISAENCADGEGVAFTFTLPLLKEQL